MFPSCLPRSTPAWLLPVAHPWSRSRLCCCSPAPPSYAASRTAEQLPLMQELGHHEEHYRAATRESYSLPSVFRTSLASTTRCNGSLGLSANAETRCR